MILSLLNRNGVSGLGFGLFVISALAGVGLTAWTGSEGPLIIGLLDGLRT
ncbi:MAG: hypothetical protein ACJ746_10240 [Bryobacteraceae bacterium]